MDWHSTLRTQYKVSDFVTWKKERGLVLNPNFQRRPVWKKGAKSYLLDTIVRGLPVPIIFLRDMRSDLKSFKPMRDVVDGQQRLRTIFSFVDPNLVEKFDEAKDAITITTTHSRELGGKTFAELPQKYQQRILDYQFSVHIFPADTDDRDILQIFARMNSTGVKANAQELRNAEFFGKFKTQAYKLAAEQLNRWRDWKIFSPDQIARMNEVELTSEFMALMTNGVMEKENTTINKAYRAYNSKYPFAKDVAKRFRHVFSTIDTFIGEAIVAGFYNTRTLFYGLFTGVYGFEYGLQERTEIPAIEMKSVLPRKLTSEVIEQIKLAGSRLKDRKNLPKDILAAIRGATTDAEQRRVLIKFIMGNKNNPCRGLR